MHALQVVNRRALELKMRDEGRADATVRMNFGAYFYRTEPRQSAPEAPTQEDEPGE